MTRTAASVFTDRTRPLRVGLIAALSGGATLAGEVLGSRLLRPLVGSTAVAQAGAIAGVLGGLGLGARFIARRLRAGRADPRRSVAYALGALTLLTLLAPWLVAMIAPTCARAMVALALRMPLVSSMLRAVIAVVLTAPFGALSGATYPALVALHGEGTGRATAVSGAASSLGAFGTVLLVTFVLAPAVGIRGSLVAVAILYVLAAALLASFPAGETRTADPSSALPTRPRETVLAIALALGIAGFASIAWQGALTRLGVLALGPSAFALGAALAAYTLALGIGEASALPRVDRTPLPRRRLAQLFALASVLAVVSTALAAHLPAWTAARFANAPPTMGPLWTSGTLLLVALMLPVITPIGAAIPLATRALGDAGLSRASANALVLSAMAAGNVVGALVGALVLTPWLTLAGVLLACAGSLAVVAAIIARPELRGRNDWIRVAIAIGLLALAGSRAVRGWDATSLSQGPFLYTGADDLDLGHIERITYGREATVAVRRDEAGDVLLQIDGKIDATSAGDTATQTLVSIVPAVLARSPRRVLVIGLGSGMTVDAARDVPGVDHVEVTELLPEVIDAARTAFASANHHALESSRVRTLHEDASLFVRGAMGTYDVVVSEPSNPWVAGMADLFTVEALRAARMRLNPGGTMAAWFHAHSTDAATFASILATFASVFPECALFEMVAGHDYMVIGFTPPVRVDVDLAIARITSPAIAAHLVRAGVPDRGSFFGHFVAGVDGVRAITADAEVFHADDLRLEFRAPALLYTDAANDIAALFARAQDLPLAGLDPFGAAYAAVIDESEPTREAALHARQMALLRVTHEYSAAIAEGEQAVAANPRDSSVRSQLAQIYLHRAGRRYRSRDPAGAEDDLRNARELHPGASEMFRANLVLGDMALARNDFRRAAEEYGASLEIAREARAPAPELHVRMAQVLAALGDLPHARSELDRAMRECTSEARTAEIDEMRARLR